MHHINISIDAMDSESACARYIFYALRSYTALMRMPFLCAQIFQIKFGYTLTLHYHVSPEICYYLLTIIFVMVTEIVL